MITSEFTQADFSAACSLDILGTQLYTGWQLYTLYPLQTGIASLENAAYTDGVFWVQHVGEKITAALGYTEKAITITASKYADFDELSAFLQSIGCNHIECSAQTASALGIQSSNLRYIQRKSTLNIITNSDFNLRRLCSLGFQLFKVYELWQAVGFGEYMSPYPEWLAIVSRKQRHGLGEIYGLLDGEELLATAAIFGRGERAAYLGGVAVKDGLRGRGLGAAVVGFAAAHAGKPFVELMCEEHNREFYRKCGFEEVGEVVL